MADKKIQSFWIKKSYFLLPSASARVNSFSRSFIATLTTANAFLILARWSPEFVEVLFPNNDPWVADVVACKKLSPFDARLRRSEMGELVDEFWRPFWVHVLLQLWRLWWRLEVDEDLNGGKDIRFGSKSKCSGAGAGRGGATVGKPKKGRCTAEGAPIGALLVVGMMIVVFLTSPCSLQPVDPCWPLFTPLLPRPWPWRCPPLPCPDGFIFLGLYPCFLRDLGCFDPMRLLPTKILSLLNLESFPVLIFTGKHRLLKWRFIFTEMKNQNYSNSIKN